MLYVTRADNPAGHRGSVIHVERSRFAPAETDLATLRDGAVDGYRFAAAYRNQLRRLWHEDRSLFLDLVELAQSSNVTLVDDWDGPPAPRFVLADVLRVLAMSRGGTGRRGLYAGTGAVTGWPVSL